MENYFIYGSYDTYTEATVAADRLVEQGVPSAAISILADDTYAILEDGRYANYNVNNRRDNRSWFEKLFGLNEEEAYNVDDLQVEGYNDVLNRGGYLLAVDREYEGSTFSQTEVITEAGSDHFNLNDDSTVTDRENIKLHEERLNVDKVQHDAGQVEITKEVIEETQTVDVPVEKEELHIRHTNRTDEVGADGRAFEEEEIVIPLTEEEVTVNKETVVTGEVEISKETHTENKEVSETTRREEIDVHGDADVVYDDDNQPTI